MLALLAAACPAAEDAQPPDATAAETTDAADEPPPPCAPAAVGPGEVRARALAADCPEDLPLGLFAAARGGDLVLENAVARFVVRGGAEGHAIMGLVGGHLVDAVALGDGGAQRGHDALREYVPTADFHLLDPDAVDVTADGADGEARVEVTGALVPYATITAVLPFTAPPVTMRHVYTLRPDSLVLELRSELAATDPDGATFTPTDMMFWSGAVDLYLPGVSPDEIPESAPAPLVGLQPADPAATAAYAVAADTPRDLVSFGPVTGFLHAIPTVDEAGLSVTRYLSLDPDGDVEAALQRAAEASEQTLAPLPGPAATGVVDATVTDPSGAAIPFRLTVRREVGGLVETHYLVDPDGAGSFELAAGSWDAWVTHGPTWSWHPTVLEVVAGGVTGLIATLEPVVDTTGLVAADLHVHAEQSPDSVIPTTRRLHAALAEGLGYLVVTEHDFVADPGAWLGPAGLSDELVVVPGVEVSTMHLGHFNTWPLVPDPDLSGAGAPVWYELDHTGLFDLLEATPGAFVQCNHPRFASGYAAFFDVLDLGEPASDAIVDRCDGVEVVNGFGHEDTDQVLGDWLGLLSRGVRVTATGTSDTHEHDDFAGNARTWVRVGDGPWTAADLDAALRVGAAVASAGPLLRLSVSDSAATAHIGETLVTSAPDVTAQVEVEAPAWMALGQLEVVVDGEVVHTEDTAGLEPVDGRKRLVLDLSVSPAVPGYVVAFHRGPAESWPGTHRPPWAVTNPVFVESP